MTDESSADRVVLERTIEASPEAVWRMWTEPNQFAAWYGPDGASTTVVTMDVRVGGARRVGMSMETPRGPMQMWFTGEHLEVDPHRRLVYTEAISDESGNVLAPQDMGMPVDSPTSTQIVVELEDLGERTRLRLTHVGVAPDSPGAAGWQMALDKLADRLT